MVIRRQLDSEEVKGLISEWQYARALGERVDPLHVYLGFTHEEMDAWLRTGEPPRGDG